MLDITAANSVNLQKPAKCGRKTWRTREQAKNDAVATLGPHARHEYEYLTFKCDGQWHWRPTEVAKPASYAELKALGGKRALPPQEPCKRTTEAPTDVAGHSAAKSIKDAVEAAIAAGLSPTEFRQLAEFVAEELKRRGG